MCFTTLNDQLLFLLGFRGGEQRTTKREEFRKVIRQRRERKDEKNFIPSRDFLDCRIKAGEKKFKDARIPRGKALAAVKMCAQWRKKIALMSRDEIRAL